MSEITNFEYFRDRTAKTIPFETSNVEHVEIIKKSKNTVYDTLSERSRVGDQMFP